MFDALLSILTGGATGLLGTGLSFVADYFQTRQRHAQEMDLRRLDLQIAQTEAASAEKVAAIEAEAERDQAEWSALEASYKEAAKRWSRGDSRWIVFVDVVRGLTRPWLTNFFVFLTGAIYFTLAAGDASLRGRIVETVLYLATTCVLWWFGSRQIAKRSEGGIRR